MPHRPAVAMVLLVLQLHQEQVPTPTLELPATVLATYLVCLAVSALETCLGCFAGQVARTPQM